MDQDRTKPGAEITDVVSGKPADEAGLKKGDVILSIDGVEIENAFTLRFEVGRRRAGDKVKLLVRRGDEESTFEATLAARPKGGAARGAGEKLPVPMPGPKGRPKRGEDR